MGAWWLAVVVGFVRRGRALAASALILGLVALAASTASPALAAGTTWYVSPKGSSSVTCATNSQSKPFATIQAALGCAANGDLISLAPSGSTPYSGVGTVSNSVTIEAASGDNARTVQVDLAKPSTTTGELVVAAGATVTIQNVGLDCISAGCADPAVTNNGTLTLQGVSVTGSYDGAILDQTTGTTAAQLTVLDSTIANNYGASSASGTYAGGITLANASPAPTATVANSTIADNEGAGDPGAIEVVPTAPGVLALTNDTITGNSGAPGGVADALCGTSCSTGSPVVASNTIIAGNTGESGIGADCNGQINDGPGGHNLLGDDTTCGGLTDAVNGDLVGVPAPGLNPLANNGGPTDTASLQPQSPAIRAGDPATCEAAPISSKDQRGHSRAAATVGCDIGAFDTDGGSGVAHATWYVSPSGSDSETCSSNSKSTPFATIQAALACASDGDIISLAPSGSKPYPGVGTLSHSVTIEAAPGANARTVQIDLSQPSTSAGPLVVPATVSARVQDVALECPLIAGCGEPDVTNNGALILNGVSVSGSYAGGILAVPASTTPPRLTVLNSSVVHNIDLGGGPGDAGAGIAADYGSYSSTGPVVTVVNSTIADNSAPYDDAGGISVNVPNRTTTSDGTTLVTDLGGLTLINDTITGNDGPTGGLSDNACFGTSEAGGQTYQCARDAILASNTVIAGNTEDKAGVSTDCDGTIVDGSGGHNLLGDGANCTGLANGANGDQVGTAGTPINPQLAPTAYDGGGTQTAPPLVGSPVIGAADAGTCAGAPVADLDERGHARNESTRDACDIGADDTGGTTPSQTAPKIAATGSTTATISSPLHFTVSATGTPTPAFSETGALPVGVGFYDNGNGTATFEGTPTGTAGTYPITITADNGVTPAATESFTLNVVALSASRVAPNTIAQGATSLPVTIDGTGFQRGATLSASNAGITFSSVTVESPKVITARETAAESVPSGSYDLTVTEPGTSATCTGCLSVLPQPTVTSISEPTLGQGASGVAVAVNGSNFWSPAKVSFTGPGSGVTGTVTFVGATSLSVKITVPAGAATGSYTLNLTNGDGGTATCSGCLTVVAGPQVSSVSPSSVAPGQKTPFTVSGSGFSSDARLSGPPGVGFTGVKISTDGTTITGTMTVSSTAAAGSNLPITVKDGPLGNYGSTSYSGLTIT